VRKLSGVASIVFDVDGAELNREKKIANVLSCSCRDARAESDSSIKEMALRRKFPCVAFALLWVRHTTPPLITHIHNMTMNTMQKTATRATQSDFIA
jgi:hypothetical protein